MANSFYVEARSGKLVEAQYLSANSSFVLDPNTTIAQSIKIYDVTGKLLPQQNTEGYLIVPVSFSLQQAEDFSYTLSTEKPAPQLLSLYNAFSHGGSQELQRTYDGLTNSAFVPAFTDAASFDFGFIGGFSGITLSEIEAGGGAYNIYSDIQHILSGHGPLITSGIDFNNPTNVNDIVAGYKLGASLKGFDGDQITLQLYYPTIDPANLENNGTATVMPGTTTFPNINALPIANSPPSGTTIVGSSVDFNGPNIVDTYPVSYEGSTFITGAFNGFVFQTANSDPAITGVLLASTNIPGLTSANLSFTAHSISINESGLTLPIGTPGMYDISATFAPAGSGDPTVTQSGVTISGDSSEIYNVTGDTLSENIGVSNTSPIFISGNTDSLNLLGSTGSFAIIDNGQGTSINLPDFTPFAGTTITINDFQLDTTGLITLPDQYATASAAVAALRSDSHGGSILPLSNGSALHFVGDANLTASNFKVSSATA